MLEWNAAKWPKPCPDATGDARTPLAPPLCDTEANELSRAIINRLALSRDAHLLDLNCGDGSLAGTLGPSVGTLLGVDRSAANVAAARSRGDRPGLCFTIGSPPGFTATAPTPWRFTAALWCGDFAQCSDGEILATLHALSVRFRRVSRVLLMERGIGATETKQPVLAERDLMQVAPLAAAAGWRVDACPAGDPCSDAGQARNLLLSRPKP